GVALVVGLVAYAVAEYAQTGRVESITSQFDTRTIVLIPIAIAINIILGQTVAAALKVPVYLGSIGTILVGVLAGPIAGALTAGPDRIFVVLGWRVALLLVGAILGLLALLFLRRDLGAAYVFVAGLACGIISAIISQPISSVVFGGVTGSGTDLLVAAFQKAG